MEAWGRYPKIKAELIRFRTVSGLKQIIRNSPEIIASGMLRSYGDQALNAKMISTREFNYITEFNNDSGIVTCQPGVTFNDLIRVFSPKGWFPPVTPGTKFVTMGGAVASDVHGKNHHIDGTFCDHLLSLDLMDHEGNLLTCSPSMNQELFYATCGGNGLTGVITSVTFKLKKIETPYIFQSVYSAKNIEELFSLFEIHRSAPYSVAWIDCLCKNGEGRGLLYTGKHASYDYEAEVFSAKKMPANSNKSKLSVPFDFPAFTLNKYSIMAFNNLYFYAGDKKNKTSFLTDFDSFFYPLDGIDNWNRIYGNKGFFQYQIVIPMDDAKSGIKEIIKTTARKGAGSFLAVLKKMGVRNSNLLSFPMAGYTLALDFPFSVENMKLLDNIDSLVTELKGRLYLTKDSRMQAKTFICGYHESIEAFNGLRTRTGANNKFMSLQSMRLGL